MIKIILLAIAIWLLVSIVKRYLKSTVAPPDIPKPTSESPAAEPESMVQCTYCGVHIPVDDSVLIGQQYYCCKAHGDAAKANPPSDGHEPH
jgi:uncharacterized protein